MKRPIGIFDSGSGGLSLLPALKKKLPFEDIVYIADHAFSPYGQKEEQAIFERSKIICQALIERNCKLILVACNTVTTQVIEQLRATYAVDFVGIEPAIKPAAKQTKKGVIGVLATQGTLKSSGYRTNVEQHAKNCNIIEQAGTGLVDYIESGDLSSKELEGLLKKHLDPMIKNGIDTIVLGCTHYPFLQPLLTKLLPTSVKIIDNSTPVAQQIDRILKLNHQLTQEKSLGTTCFFSTLASHKMMQFTDGPISYLPL